MIRLSIIVPVYGVEEYIEECIRSLYDQDIPQEEYEVICVDDCSPDNSRAIVERLQMEYPTLKLLTHTENKRQGGARNTGLREAKGQYVWFVDSDDTIKPNCLKGMLEQAEKEDLDVLQFYYSTDGKQPKQMIEYGICTGSKYVFDAPMDEKPLLRSCVVWRGLIRKSLLIDNNIWFAEHVQHEDDDYAYMVFAKAQRVHLIPLAFYCFRTRQGSTMHSAYTYQTAIYYALQVRRLITIAPELERYDKRWHAHVQEMVRWICKGVLIDNMEQLPEEDQKRFYKEKLGRIPGLWKWVPVKTWIKLRVKS